VRLLLSPNAAPPGDVQLTAARPASGSLQETARRSAELARPLAPGEKIDLDRADAETITRLPRIGPALAQRIVAWRQERGLFGSIERLDSVPGVGPKLLETIRPYVKFSGSW
jgi:competence ComEA-like helix-hairpin-helix protein